MRGTAAGGPDARGGLRAQCAACVGYCCVAFAFARSADFAIDKAVGEACPHLGTDSACRIHAGLRESGFRGCSAYDCFGAGQRVARAGLDWRAGPVEREHALATFRATAILHELLWYLAEAAELVDDGEVAEARAATEALAAAGGTPDAAQVAEHRTHVAAVLRRVSASVRAGGGRGPALHRAGPRADLAGARLAGADLRAADLRGALLIAADLRGADLRGADLIGADLRDADLRGADLRALFLTPAQVAVARGDGATRLPPHVHRPDHWGAR